MSFRARPDRRSGRGGIFPSAQKIPRFWLRRILRNDLLRIRHQASREPPLDLPRLRSVQAARGPASNPPGTSLPGANFIEASRSANVWQRWEWGETIDRNEDFSFAGNPQGIQPVLLYAHLRGSQNLGGGTPYSIRSSNAGNLCCPWFRASFPAGIPYPRLYSSH